MGTRLFGEIVKRADIESLRPIAFSARRGRPGDSDRSSDVSLEESYRYSVNDEHSAAVVRYRFVVAQEPEDDQTKSDLFEATAEYEIVYRFDPPLTPEHETELEAFAKHNGRFNCWPFLREYLARVTAEFGLPVLTLPLMKPIGAPVQEQDESAEAD